MIPPVGLLRQDLWFKTIQTKRMHDILEAMKRFSECSKPIPLDWIYELGNLVLIYQIIPV